MANRSLRNGCVIALLSLSPTLAYAQPRPAEKHPLRDSLKYVVFDAAGQIGLDHASSVWFSNGTKCHEGNARLQNEDGSYDWKKGLISKAMLVGANWINVYISEKAEMPRWIQRLAKGVSIASGSVGAATGVKNILECR